MDWDRPWILAETIQSAIQAPIYHFILEGLLIAWIFRLLLFKSYKIHEKDPPTEQEKQDLINDWQPEPLVPPLKKTLAENAPYHLVSGRLGKDIIVNGYKCKNFSAMNFLGLLGNSKVEEETEKCIRKYGVGSCGPRGFYGTVDVHLELEERLAKYMGAEEAIIYSYGFATVGSAIPAYSKRRDIIFVDRAVCFAIQKGLQASRSTIVYFQHNNMEDLEEKLKEQERKDLKDPKKAGVVRKFIVVEGIYMNTGQLCDLPRLIEMKYKYKVRLFIEESLSFGVLGEHGRGVTEHFNIPISKVDLITATLEYALASIGGFCCGRRYTVNHQRISGMGYVFSASLPPLLSRAAIVGLNLVEQDPDIFYRLRKKAAYFQELLRKIKGIEVMGYCESPSFHIRKSESVSSELDVQFLRSVVDQSIENGVCITMASRLRDEELLSEWPASIRVAISDEMTEEELEEAASVIATAVTVAMKNSIE